MTGPDFTKRHVSGQPQFDPVTGAPLPPGPAAYSAVEPVPPADPFGHPGGAPTALYPNGYPATGQQYPATGQQYPAPGQQYPATGQQYPAPGYPPAGYPAAAPPPGYPMGYPPVGYQMVPVYPVAQRPAKPGAATAAAVLAYVQSGFVLIGAIAMFSGSNGLDTFSRGNDLSSELTVIAIIAVLAGGLLIAGATTVLNRKPTMLLMGNVLSLAISIYFAIRLMDVAFGVGLWLPILYAVLPIISMALAWSADVRAWVRARTYDQG